MQYSAALQGDVVAMKKVCRERVPGALASAEKSFEREATRLPACAHGLLSRSRRHACPGVADKFVPVTLHGVGPTRWRSQSSGRLSNWEQVFTVFRRTSIK